MKCSECQRLEYFIYGTHFDRMATVSEEGRKTLFSGFTEAVLRNRWQC